MENATKIVGFSGFVLIGITWLSSVVLWDMVLAAFRRRFPEESHRFLTSPGERDVKNLRYLRSDGALLLMQGDPALWRLRRYSRIADRLSWVVPISVMILVLGMAAVAVVLPMLSGE